MTSAPVRRRVVVLAAVASIMAALDTLVVATALTTIQRDLHASLDTLEWTVNAYNLSFAALLMTAAALGDRYGRARMFALGLTIFVIASAACGFARSAPELIAARAVQGVGAALVSSLALALVGAVFPAERRGAVLGGIQGATGLATACGPLLGGAIAQGLAWQWIFWVNVPIGLIAIPLALRRIPDSRGPDPALDLPGLTLVTTGAFALLYALMRGASTGWTTPAVLVAAATGSILLTAFVRWELRTPAPMLPMSLFRARGFTAGNTAVFLAFAALFAAVFFYPQLLQSVLGLSPLRTGVLLLPWTLTLVCCAPFAGKLTDRIGPRPVATTGLTFMALGMFRIATVSHPAMSYAPLIIPLIISGIGTALVVPATQSATLSAVHPDLIGKAAGASSTMREFGGVFGTALAATIFTTTGAYTTRETFTAGFRPAIAFAAALALLGALTSLGLPTRRKPTEPTNSRPAQSSLLTRFPRNRNNTGSSDVSRSTSSPPVH